jgi:thiol-disulfide isomerase/thioredoxin
MKKIILFILLIVNVNAFSQANIFNSCNVLVSQGNQRLYSVNANQLNCISKISEKQLLVYVYEWWCKPCNEKIVEVKTFATTNNLELIVLTIDKENSKATKKDEDLLTSKYKIENIAVVSDSYGKSDRKKYANFLKEIYKGKKAIEDLSKLILYDKTGNVKYISNWQDGTDVLKDKIFPLLEN